jgi:hypothetical protein
MALLCALLPLGCSPAPRPVDPADDAWQSAPGKLRPGASAAASASGAQTAANALPRWEHAARLHELRAVGGRGRSEHLDGQHEREVRVNDLALGYERLGAAAVMPVGALVVELHYAPGSNDPDGIFAMEKRAAGFAPEQHDWELVVLDRELRVQARGKLPLCARCHMAAPHDGLFGLPKDALAPSPTR